MECFTPRHNIVLNLNVTWNNLNRNFSFKYLLKKNVKDLNTKHFSRYGEFLVSFELAKYGWNVYSPMYDEYIDIVAHKFSCKKCGKIWNITPALICSDCGEDFSKSEKKNIIAKKVCKKCKNEAKGNMTKCTKCSGVMKPIPTCNKCHKEVKMKYHECECGHDKYDDKIKTIQVKSSRIEFKNGKSKKTYAVDLKPKDMIQSKNHFFIWCLIDDNDISHFLVMSVKDFKDTMGDSMKGTSFLKDQDRQHFSSDDFGKWDKFEDQFTKLE